MQAFLQSLFDEYRWAKGKKEKEYEAVPTLIPVPLKEKKREN